MAPTTLGQLADDDRFVLGAMALQMAEADRRYTELYARWTTLQTAVLAYDDAVKQIANQRWAIEDVDKLYEALLRAAGREL